MKNNSNIILYLVIGLVVVGLIAFFALQSNPDKQYNWRTTFKHDRNEPYDFSLFKALVEESYQFEKTDYSDHGKLSTTLDAVKNPENANYIFLGHYPYHTKEDATALKNFVEKGAIAFLLCDNIPDSILQNFITESDCRDNLLDNRDLKTISEASISAVFVNENLEDDHYDFSFKRGAKDTSDYSWCYIDYHYYAEDYCYGSNAFARVGYFENSDGYNYTNFVRMKVGEGAIYWHTNPVLFSNLYLSNDGSEVGFAYIDKVLAHSNDGKVVWDLASTVAPPRARNSPQRQPRSYDKPDTPMEYIFSQPSLTWAWLLFLGTAVLYGLFGAKRRQRTIPIVEINRNTSLEFVSTIGRLYFQQQNHAIIFEKIMELYLSHLRNRYSIVVQEMDEATVQRIVLRSDVSAQIVSDIFGKYKELHKKLSYKGVEMSQETLNRFYMVVEKFYAAEKARKLTPAKK